MDLDARRADTWPRPEPSSHRVEVDPYVVVSSVVIESPPVRTSTSHIRLRYALWASFLIILVFALAGAKFYLYQQVGSGGLEVVATCAIMVGIMYLVVGCSLHLCRSSQRAAQRQAASAPVNRPPPPPPPPPQAQEGPSQSSVSEHVRTTQPIEPPPPPYHIAVALPHCVTPPPSYDKAVS